jgi:excisionase family DNA binding protein
MENQTTVQPRAGDVAEQLGGPSARHAPNRLLTADEVAAQLGVGVKWVWAQARAGAIPHVKLGRYRRFRPEAIDHWIADLERRSSA